MKIIQKNQTTDSIPIYDADSNEEKYDAERDAALEIYRKDYKTRKERITFEHGFLHGIAWKTNRILTKVEHQGKPLTTRLIRELE